MPLREQHCGQTDNDRHYVVAVMPFAALERPSLAASQIAAYIRRAGHSCTVEYASLRFADRVGLDFHALMMSNLPDPTDLFGEWLFAKAAFGCEQGTDRYPEECIAGSEKTFGYLKQVFGCRDLEGLTDQLEGYRELAADFVDETAAGIVAQKPFLVGATSMFQQNTASMALLRRVKELAPGIRTVLGGANCEAPMGQAWQEICPWIDEVHSGRIEGHEDRVLCLPRRFEENPGIKAGPVLHPDFSDYFQQLSRMPYCERVRPGLPIEMSTGCWYGARRHCTFCGLNAKTMAFRARPADDVHGEIAAQAECYERHEFFAVDNIIAMDYFKTLLPRLANEGPGIRLFIETKANLTKSHVETLAAAGVRWIQPGIEALNDDKLARFNKGTDLKTNLVLLKNCLEQGITVIWGLLVCEPGDRQDEYHRMAAIIPKIVHLMPPTGVGPVRFDRFSPYHSFQRDHGLNLQACKAYGHVYPQETDTERAAYYFHDPDYKVADRDNSGLFALAAACRKWQEIHHSPDHQFRDQPGNGHGESRPGALLEFDPETRGIRDKRYGGDVSYQLTPLEAEVMASLHQGRSKRLFREAFPDFDLERWIERGLILDTGHHYLFLPVLRPRRPMPGPEDFPGGFISP